MKVTATRRICFDAGHRVYGHEGKCRNLHGHSYKVFLTAEAPQLDALGRVIDFGVLKGLLGTWIDEKWDHGFLLCREDKEAQTLVGALEGQKLYILPYNPTAENIGKYLLEEVGPRVLEDSGVKLVKVDVWETENCLASVTLE